MNIQAANAAGDAAEFAEISAEKSPLCEKYTSTLVQHGLHAWWCYFPFPCDIPPTHARPNV